MSGLLSTRGRVVEDAPGKIRVRVILGGHDYDSGLESFLASKSDQVTMAPWPNALDFPDDSADVLILYDYVPQSDSRIRERLQRWLQEGKGIIVLHHALADFQDWTWWREEVTGAAFILPGFGARDLSTFQPDVQETLYPKKQHPVLNNIAAFKLTDEVYGKLWISPNAEVLVESHNAFSSGPSVWIGPSREAKVLCIQPGHGVTAFSNRGLQELIRNAVAWVATPWERNRLDRKKI